MANKNVWKNIYFLHPIYNKMLFLAENAILFIGKKLQKKKKRNENRKNSSPPCWIAVWRLNRHSLKWNEWAGENSMARFSTEVNRP